MTLEELCEDLKAAQCGLNDQAIILIEACIASGLTDDREIVDKLRGLGFDGQHVGILLTKSAGPDPKRHRWSKDGDGRYRLFD